MLWCLVHRLRATLGFDATPPVQAAIRVPLGRSAYLTWLRLSGGAPVVQSVSPDEHELGATRSPPPFQRLVSTDWASALHRLRPGRAAGLAVPATGFANQTSAGSEELIGR